MAKYQLPPLKDERMFEEFVCDLINEVEHLNNKSKTAYQLFGVKGQGQKGIDIYSATTGTVIQCKLKDISKAKEDIRRSLMVDITTEVAKAGELDMKVARFIVVSTFRDGAKLQEFAGSLPAAMNLPFTVDYWGWDTLSKYAEAHSFIMDRYFPTLKAKPVKSVRQTVELPDGALGKDLAKKNYVNYLSKRYGDWKQLQFDKEGNGEKFNWAGHNKGIMNRYHATGINFIPVYEFDDLVAFLKSKIDKTLFGRNQKAKGRRNYSELEEHIMGVLN